MSKLRYTENMTKKINRHHHHLTTSLLQPGDAGEDFLSHEALLFCTRVTVTGIVRSVGATVTVIVVITVRPEEAQHSFRPSMPCFHYALGCLWSLPITWVLSLYIPSLD
jgi:hypothetical protein